MTEHVFQDLGDNLTKALLSADFDLYVSIVKLHGVTDIYRRFPGVDAVRDGEMAGYWTTHILVRANRLVDRFNTTMRVRNVKEQRGSRKSKARTRI